MPTRSGWLALGVGAYLAFAVGQFPAATAYRWFAPDELRLAGISGSIWSGQAALGSIPGLPLHDLRWDLSAPSLLIGRVSAAVEARLADGFVNTNVVASLSRVRLTDLQATTSLQTLRELLQLAATEGQVSATLERLDLEDGWPVAMTGELRIAGLRVAPLVAAPGQGMIALGDYRAQFIEQDEPGLSGTLNDLGGPLELDGRLLLRPDRSYALTGLIKTRPEASRELNQGIEIMTGEPNQDGMRDFEFTGSL